jgi:hypothetical protein
MAKPKTFDNRDVSWNAGKSFNLSKRQLRKAGAAKVAKRTVDIGKTTRAVGTGKTLGPKGKPLNGSVKLPSGVTAVYKDGKRVTTARKSTGGGGGRGATGGKGGSGGGGTYTPPQKPNPPNGKTAAEKRAAALKRRQTNNSGVASGTVKVGAKGKSVRKYDAKTGRWKVVTQGGNTTTSNQNQGQTSAQKPAPVKPAAKPTSSKPATKPSVPKSTYNSQVPADKRTMAEKNLAAIGNAASNWSKKASGPWVSAADKAKEAKKRKLNADVIAKATKGR